jgi:hypothetical protein
MVASVTRIHSPFNFLPNQILICCCHSQISELCHIFETSVTYLHFTILPCFLVMRQQHTLNFLCVYFWTNLLLASTKVCVFFFMVSMLSPSRFISSAYTSSRCVSFNFSPTWFSWTFIMAYYKEKLKSNGDKASYFRPFWIGNLSDKCLPVWTLLQVLFKHILISLTSFMGSPNSMTILYNTSS